jgi:hypothetical protein
MDLEEQANYTGSFQDWIDGPQQEGFRREFSIRNVRETLVRFHLLQMSYDYYDQFTRGDHIFEDYLTTYYGLEKGPWFPGKGVERTVYDQNGGARMRYSRVLLSRQEGGDWWQIVQRQGESEILHESLVGPYGIPREIRFIDPGSKAAGSRETMLGESVAEAEAMMSPEEISSRLNEDREEKVREKLPSIYADLEETGRGQVVVAGRSVYAARFTASTEAGEIALYYSPDTPGGLLRMTFNGDVFMEITDWLENGKRVIDDSDIPVSPPGEEGFALDDGSISEGLPSEPIELRVGEPHYGMVGPDEMSCYTVKAPYRGDLVIDIITECGYVSLYNFQEDNSFSEWVSGTEGTDVEHVTYYVEKGDRIFFGVEGHPEHGPEGSEYTIALHLNPLLDPLGVRIYGDYAARAKTLRNGATHRLRAMRGALEFYRIFVNGTDRMRVEVANVSLEDVDFKFLDVMNGSYGSMGGAWRSKNEKHIELTGLSEGSSVYFYLVTSPSSEPRDVRVRVMQ